MVLLVTEGGGTQTIIIKQPLEIVTTKPDVIKVDPTKK